MNSLVFFWFFLVFIEINPQGVFILRGNHTSVQQAVDQAKSSKQVVLKDPWKFEVKKIPMQAKNVTQETKIVGTPPELIVFRFDHLR